MKYDLFRLKRLSRFKDLGQKGQTAVEYILLLAVVMLIGGSLFKKVEGYLISDPDSIAKTYVKSFENMFGGQNGSFQGQYKYFTIKGK